MEALENKILIGVDTDRVNEDRQHIQEIIFPAFLGAKDAFRVLGVEPDEKMIKNAVSGRFADIENEVYQTARSDADRLNSQIARDNLISGVRKTLQYFRDEVKKFSRDIRVELLDYVSFKDGEPVISDKSLRDLKRIHSQFIHYQRGKEVFEAANEVVDKLRNLCQLIRQTNPNWDIDKIIDHFVDVDVQTQEPVLSKGINFDWFDNQAVE